MKKITALVLGVMMAVTLAACAPTEKSITSQGGANTPLITPSVEETEMVEKIGDINAPVLAMVFVYYGNSNSTGLERIIENAEVLDAQALVDFLIQYKVLEEGTKVNSFKLEGGEKAGPGVDASKVGSGERIGTLDLSELSISGTSSEPVILAAIGNTFIENFELDKLKLLVNGKNYSGKEIVQGDEDYLLYEEKYKDFKK